LIRFSNLTLARGAKVLLEGADLTSTKASASA